jgi:hypothetical protein
MWTLPAARGAATFGRGSQPRSLREIVVLRRLRMVANSELRQVSVEGSRYFRPMHYYHLLRHPAGLALVGGLAALDLVSRAVLRSPNGAV